MSSDVLATVDATLEQRCACLCGQPISDRSPSGFFASESCSQQWHLEHFGAAYLPGVQQQARQWWDQVAAWLRELFESIAEALRPVAEVFAQLAEQFGAIAVQAEPAPKTHGPPRPVRPPKCISPPSGWHTGTRATVWRPRFG